MKTLILISMISLAFVSNAAFAAMVCTASKMVQGQEVPCARMTIPDGASISTKLSCNEYNISVKV